MAITYFGNCDAAGNGLGSRAYNYGSSMYSWKTVGYSCPGSGTQNVISIGCQINEVSSYSSGLLMGVYSGTTLVFKTTSEKAGIVGWVEWSAAECTGTKILTGGSTYMIVFYGDAAVDLIVLDTASGNVKQVTGEITDMPGTLAAGTNYDEIVNVRVGVEPAGGGSVVSQGMNYYRRLRS